MRAHTIIMHANIDLGKNNAPFLHVMGIARGFADEGYRVVLVVAKPDTLEYVARMAHPHVEIVYHYTPSFLKRPRFLGAIFGLPTLVWQISRCQKIKATSKLSSSLAVSSQRKIDSRSALPPLAFVYIRMSILSALPLGLMRLMGHRTMSEHNGWVADEVRLQGYGAWLKPALNFWQCADMLLATRVRAVTEGIKNKLVEATSQRYASKIIVIGNGTHTHIFTPLKRTNALKQAGFDPKKRYLGFVGTLAKWQGVALLVRAMEVLAPEFPDLELIIAGSGQELDSLKASAAHHGLEAKIHFTGFVPLERVNVILNCFDIALSPAILERNQTIGLSALKIRDYAAAGRTMLIADIPGYTELAAEGIARLHRPEDLEDITTQIRFLLNHPDPAQSLAQNARTYALQHFDWRCMSQAILQVMGEFN